MARSLSQDLEKLRTLKERKKRTKESADKAAAEHDRFERQVFARMEQAGVEAQKMGGTNFIRTETVYGQVQDRDAFIHWAEENDVSLVERKERKALVSELVRERLDNGESLPPGLGFYVKQYIGQRAS